MATSTTQLTHSFPLTRFTRFALALIKNAHNLAFLGAGKSVD